MSELFIVLAIGYFFIVLLTLFKRGTQGRIARTLIIYALFSAIGLVIHYLALRNIFGDLNGSISTWSPYFTILFLSILFVALTRNFLGLRTQHNFWIVFGFCWFGAILITFRALSFHPDVLVAWKNFHLYKRTLFITLFSVGYMLMMGGAALLTAKAYRSAKAPLYKNRNVYWLLALTFTIGGDALAFGGFEVSGGLLRLIGTFFAAYVLLIYDLADALQAGIRVLFYMIISALSLGIYGLVLFPLRLFLEKRIDDPTALWVVLAILLVLLINPLLQFLIRGLRQIVMGASYNTSSAIREYSLRISNMVDLETLAAAAMDTLYKTLDIQVGYLFVVDEINQEGRIGYNLRQVIPMVSEEIGAKSEGEDNESLQVPIEQFGNNGSSLTTTVPMDTTPAPMDAPLVGHLSTESPIALYFTQTHQPLRQYDLDYSLAFQNVVPEERDWLRSLDADLCVPIYDKRGWTGLLVLGPRVSGIPYSKEDVNLLVTLADQTSVALANARHFSDLLALNEDLRQTYVALQKANQQLLEVDELKSAFIGVITHEMRTPFANLQFNVQILEMYGKENLLPEQLDQLVELGKGVKTARRMVDNLITLAGFFSRQIELAPELLDIKEIMRNTYPPLKEFADAKNITFQVDIVGKLLPVRADPRLMEDVFYQLAHNAIKFTHDGGKVWVSCWTTATEFCFDVKDTGVGIPAERLQDIWKTFTQTADPLRRGLEGLGLGLALVRNIVTAHGGEVWVESQVGTGSVFGFRIPLGKVGTPPLPSEEAVPV